MSDRLLLGLGLPMLILSPIVSAYLSLRVPLGEPSIMAVLVLIGVLCGIGGLLAGSVSRLPYGGLLRVLVLTGFVLVFLDMTTRSNIRLSDLSDSRVVRLSLLALCGVATFALIWSIREKVATILFAGASTLLVSSVLVPVAFASEAMGQRTVYVVLDEMVGLAAMDSELPGADETRAALEDLFQRRGFRYYPNAFSRHYLTQRSLPAVHNYDFDDNDYGIKSRYADSSSASKLETSQLLSDARSAGHRVGVFQTAHLDFCTADVERCETFDSFNMAGEFVDYSPTALTGLFMLARAFEGSYSWAMADRVLTRVAGESYSAIPSFYDIHAFPKWIEHIGQAIVDGDATFVYAHILAPHAPSIYDRECRRQERLDAGYRLIEEQRRSPDDASRSRRSYYEWYFEQTLCLVATLDIFLETLDRSEAWSDARIVLHGDHGSRISMGSLAENVDDRDMIDNYATLYAIREPGLAGGPDTRQTSIQRLTAEYFSGRTLEQLGPDNDTVAIDSQSGTAIVRRMPDLQ